MGTLGLATLRPAFPSSPKAPWRRRPCVRGPPLGCRPLAPFFSSPSPRPMSLPLWPPLRRCRRLLRIRPGEKGLRDEEGPSAAASGTMPSTCPPPPHTHTHTALRLFTHAPHGRLPPPQFSCQAFWEISMEQVQDVVDSLEAEMVRPLRQRRLAAWGTAPAAAHCTPVPAGHSSWPSSRRTTTSPSPPCLRRPFLVAAHRRRPSLWSVRHIGVGHIGAGCSRRPGRPPFASPFGNPPCRARSAACTCPTTTLHGQTAPTRGHAQPRTAPEMPCSSTPRPATSRRWSLPTGG